MEHTEDASKNRLLKTLAVLGFLLVIAFITWLAVILVQNAPTAFTNLASLAESLNEGRLAQNEIKIDTKKDVVNSDESFTISWSDLGRKGSYTFMYECSDGVSLDTRIKGETIKLNCDTLLPIPENTFSLDIQLQSEKNRFSDVIYQVAFTKDDQENVFASADQVVTVVNAGIPQGGVAGVNTSVDAESDVEVTETAMSEEAEEETPVASKPASTPTSAPVPTQTIYTTTLTIPVSDPNGYTELAIMHRGVGVLDKNDRFIAKAEIDTNDKAAFQFEVRNVGTKTSGLWHFVADLTSGEEYESKVQEPLKPNERAIITLAFRDPGKDGFREFGATIYGGNDQNPNNNSYEWGVTIND